MPLTLRLHVFLLVWLILVFACGKTLDFGDVDLSQMEPQVAAKIRMLQEEAEKSPDSAAAWGRLGMTLDVHGIKKKGSECYQKAAELDAEDFRWPYYNAMLLKDTGSEQTLTWFEQAEQRDPKYIPLKIHYGTALQAAGKTDEAAKRFQNAIRLDASSAHAWLGLAQIAMSNGNVQEARRSAERAVQLNPNFREGHNFLAGVYRKSGDSLKAVQSLERSKATPDSTPLADPVFAALANEGVSAYWYRARGRTYLQTGHYELALKEFRKALELQPDPEAYDNFGVALQGVGKWREAIANHRKAISMKPTYLNYLNLGLAYGRTGDLDRAADAFNQSIKMNPDHAEAHYNLGVIYIKRENWSDSLHALQRAVELQPNHANALHALTLAYLAAGQEHDACESLLRFVRIHPNDPRSPKLTADTRTICNFARSQ